MHTGGPTYSARREGFPASVRTKLRAEGWVGEERRGKENSRWRDLELQTPITTGARQVTGDVGRTGWGEHRGSAAVILPAWSWPRGCINPVWAKQFYGIENSLEPLYEMLVCMNVGF